MRPIAYIILLTAFSTCDVQSKFTWLVINTQACTSTLCFFDISFSPAKAYLPVISSLHDMLRTPIGATRANLINIIVFSVNQHAKITRERVKSTLKSFRAIPGSDW